MHANTYPAEQHRLPPGRLWYGFTVAAAAWALEGVIGVIVSAQFCPADLPHWGLTSQTSVQIALGIITLVLLAIAISGGVVAFRNWQALAGHREFTHAEGINREAFMSMGGILVSVVFSIGIIYSGIPIIILNQCMRAH